MQNHQALRERYQQVRHISEQICAPLAIEDYQIQSIVETSPPKWHLAHVTWFFETFLLKPYLQSYQAFHPQFDVLFNSYYQTLGNFHPRAQRGLLSRPLVKEVYAYRHAIDEAMAGLFDKLEQHPDEQLLFFIELGINHEQQHQELMCMDIKHNFSVNPLKPAYRKDLAIVEASSTEPMQWHSQAAGMYKIGHSDASFAYDNESPRHPQYLPGYQLANRLVTNEEYLVFIEDRGYQRVELWLSDGWQHMQQHNWQYPLYWQQEGCHWQEMTLAGMRRLNPHQPVCHISYYEADAYARWAGKRLPTEAEIEVVLEGKAIAGNFFEKDALHPMPAGADEQWYGDLWNWTSTAYCAYPGFKPLPGSAGEYNAKFMNNQRVLRGGSCVSSQNHIRASYRNFFYPHDRWQFSGIRLANDVA